ncbi:MAG: dihydropteroate synthase-like protein [Desulfurococcaceae archaeon]
MKILLVTGLLAEKTVRETIRETNTKHEVDVVTIPVQVISLLSTEQIANYLKQLNIDKNKYDLIIIPGLCPGSTQIIEEKTGIPCFKGTIHAFDLSILLKLDELDKILSREKPADFLIEKYILDNNLKTLIKLEEVKKTESIKIGRIYIPVNPPPFRILSELTNVHLMNEDFLLKKVNELIDKGADIVSIGFESKNPHPDLVYNIVKTIKREFDIPIAIDTLIPSEILKGVEAGVDIVLSIDYCNVEHVIDYIRETIPVIIPYDSCRNYLPDTSMRILYIDRLIDKIRDRLEHYILDPILDPPVVGNLFESINNYRELKRKYSDKPLLMGVSNVVELIDADSIGLNTLLSVLALDVKASILLVVEASSKTIDSTRELAIASEMITLAYIRRSPPKDLGIDLLFVKDKRRIDYKIDVEDAEEITIENFEYREECKPQEYFRIRVDHENRFIETLCVSRDRKLLIKSRSIEALKNYILENKLVSSIPHAMYLGIELGKASEAIRINKNYIQDQPLFREKKLLKTMMRGFKQHG